MAIFRRMRRRIRTHATSLVEAGGALCVAVGFGLFHLGLGLIVGGSLAIVGAFLAASPHQQKDPT